MQVIKRTAFFLYAFLMVAGYALGSMLVDPGMLRLSADGTPIWPGIVLLALMLVIFMGLLSSTTLSAEMGWDGIHLPEMARWVACGLFTGLLAGIIQARWASSLSAGSLPRTLYESFGAIAVFSLVFWLIFRRNFWSVPSKSDQAPSRFFGWVLLVIGLFIFSGGAIMLASIRAWETFILVAAGFTFCGAGLILISALILLKKGVSKRVWMGWTGGGLIFAGVVFTLLGFFLG